MQVLDATHVRNFCNAIVVDAQGLERRKSFHAIEGRDGILVQDERVEDARIGELLDTIEARYPVVR